jgi:hypothetical protein
MTAHGDQVRCHCGAGPFFASGAPSDQRPGDADPALKQIYLCVTQPTANSEEAKLSENGASGANFFALPNL